MVGSSRRCLLVKNWIAKLLIVGLSAGSVLAFSEGGRWLADHPVPEGAMMPAAMLAGLVGLVYGARKGR